MAIERHAVVTRASARRVKMMASSNSGALIGSSSTVGGINVAGMGVVGGGGASAAATGGSGGGGGVDELLPLVKQLTNPDQREVVLLELSKKRESFPDLAPILWHTTAVVSALLIEIVSIYPLLTPPTLTAHASNRVCNALALLQCVASHSETRQPFLAAQIPLYLYPFLNTNVLYIRTNSYLPSFMAQIQLTVSQSKSRPFEYLRLTSLGVIGALVKVDDAEVISFLLSTEIIPLCLRIMETGSELSKTVSTFIVQKILLEETGLNYVCATAERFFAVSQVLANMVSLLTVHPSVRLLKHVVRCYLRLADHARAREALKTCLPSSLRDATFATALQNDPVIQKWLQQLLANISGNGGPASAPTGATSAAAGGSNAPSLLSSAAGVPQASSTAAANSNPSAGLGLLDMSNAAGKAQ